jgi:hypothetical protein
MILQVQPRQADKGAPGLCRRKRLRGRESSLF